MANKFKRSAAVLALAASASMVATPAMARGWGGGWGGHARHHDRIDGGDVLAGILIVGGIAAIASAASKAARQQGDYRQPQPRYREEVPRYGEADDRPEWRDGTGIDGAVNRCIDEVNRGRNRVGEVESVNRDGGGWRVAGTTTGDSSFSCVIDRDGRIRSVSVAGRAI
jgi:hypothetical protein